VERRPRLATEDSAEVEDRDSERGGDLRERAAIARAGELHARLLGQVALVGVGSPESRLRLRGELASAQDPVQHVEQSLFDLE
jgi:hypothetical protein